MEPGVQAKLELLRTGVVTGVSIGGWDRGHGWWVWGRASTGLRGQEGGLVKGSRQRSEHSRQSAGADQNLGQAWDRNRGSGQGSHKRGKGPELNMQQTLQLNY